MALMLVLHAGASGPAVGEPGMPTAMAIVVGVDSPIRDLTPDVLREVYMRRRRVWPDGRRVMPVNLPADDPLRSSFSAHILGRRPRELVGYWNRLYFEGIRPPLVLRSPAAICAYLASEPGGVGYVPSDQVDESSCRVVLTLNDAGP
jgi:hypothetical protein